MHLAAPTFCVLASVGRLLPSSWRIGCRTSLPSSCHSAAGSGTGGDGLGSAISVSAASDSSESFSGFSCGGAASVLISRSCAFTGCSVPSCSCACCCSPEKPYTREGVHAHKRLEQMVYCKDMVEATNAICTHLQQQRMFLRLSGCQWLATPPCLHDSTKSRS